MGLKTALGLKKRKDPTEWLGKRKVPWITDGAVAAISAFLASRPKRSAVALECGSGASTFWTACHVSRLISIEHDRFWAKYVNAELERRGLSNVDYRVRRRPYVGDLLSLPRGSIDFALIDGRDRVACIAAARQAIKPGGILVLDNAERIDGRYFLAPRFLKSWKRQDHEQFGPDQTGWKSRKRWITTIWTRPA